MAAVPHRQFILEMNRLLLGATDDNESSSDHGRKDSSLKISSLAENLLLSIEQDDIRKVQDILSSNNSPTKILSYCVTTLYVTTPLEYACKKGTRRILSTMLRYLPDKSLLGEINNGYSPFHYAASCGNTETLQLIMDMEVVDINLQNPNNKTPLHLAASCGHEESVKVLLENSSINIDAHDITGETPLSLAAANGYSSIVGILLKKGANIDNKSLYGLTPLLNAACKEKTNVVIELLRHGADATVSDVDGDTVLHFLRRSCPPELLRELLSRGALLGAMNKRGVTPLHGLNAKLLEEVLNDSVTTSLIPDSERGRYMKDHKKVKFNNPFATADHQTNSDLKNFIAISESKKHEHLVFHPLFKSLISMKWQVVQRLYFIKLVIFFIFVTCLSTYIFLDQNLPPESSSNIENSNLDSQENQDQNFDNINHQNSDHIWLQIIMYFFITYFISIRLLETIFRWRINYKSFGHWLEIIFLILTVGYFIQYKYFAVPVLLLAWIQAFLHVSRYPLVSPLYFIFCYISKSFLTFILFSLLLLIGFLLSFHFLFKHCDGGEYCIDKVFKTLPSSALKLASMMIGEIGYEQFPLEDRFSIWGPLLATFMFFICFVLMNMMNGLAVSDTQDLRKRAEFSTIVAQGEMILSIESFINELWWAPILSKVRIFLVPKISSFKVLPSSGLCLEAVPDKCIKGQHLSLDVIEQAKLLADKRKRPQSTLNLEELKSYLDQLRDNIDHLIDAKLH